MRTMAFSTEHVSANNLESLLFILFLLIFAVAAAIHVWNTGVASGRKKPKLLLDCIMIITSVVPPELPMELSLAVNQSLIALSRQAIFCLEPFRIPAAGKVSVGWMWWRCLLRACFFVRLTSAASTRRGRLRERIWSLKDWQDWVGLLMRFELISRVFCYFVTKRFPNFSDDLNKLHASNQIPNATALVINTCHSLVLIDGRLIGDPMEKTVMETMKWDMGAGGVLSSPDQKYRFKIQRRFPFSSALKRMAVISSCEAAVPSSVSATLPPSKGKKPTKPLLVR